MFWPEQDVDERVLAFLKRQPFAHRGLHDAGAGVPENSFAAFDRAIKGGWGIELDVQLTLDANTVVFHDETLDRLTDATGPLARRTRVQLERVRLKGSDEPIHTLANALMHIRGRAPVLIEAKTVGNNHNQVAASVRRALEGYRGPAAVMSFNPNVLHWFARHAPRIVRGLVMTEEPRRPLSRYNLRRRIARQASVLRAKPHFLAFDIRRLPSPFVAAARTRMPVLTWTVRTEEQRAVAAAHADQIIFEVAPGDPAGPG